ncbi:MAG: hypothetical protein IKR81_02875, partial [Victivallales bacterium]|nr:hypothetical protein [Victivallales bacterium]
MQKCLWSRKIGAKERWGGHVRALRAPASSRARLPTMRAARRPESALLQSALKTTIALASFSRWASTGAG